MMPPSTGAPRTSGVGTPKPLPSGNPHVRMILLDTNVWLDNYLGGRDCSASRDLIQRSLELGITLLYAITSVKDVYYCICQDLKRCAREEDGTLSDGMADAAEEAAWQCVQNIRSIATAVGSDESDLWLAARHHDLHRDLDDNLVVAAAIRSKANLFVTRDKQLLARSAVAALSPADALAYIG